MSVDEQEAIQVVQYYPGQKYSYHTDFTVPPQVIMQGHSHSNDSAALPGYHRNFSE